MQDMRGDSGRGKLTWRDGSSYEGQLKDGRMHGEGVLSSPSGYRYEGQFKDGFKNGPGTLVDGDRRYEGQWKADKRHGQGTRQLHGGRSYEGQWKAGLEDGKGAFTFADGGRYEGQLKGARHEGRGTYTFASGNRYTGEWSDHLAGGVGKFKFADGTAWAGSWAAGEPVGGGTWTFVVERRINARGAVLGAHVPSELLNKACRLGLGPTRSQRLQASATPATVAERVAQRRAAERVPPAELVGKEIEIDGVGAGDVTGPFKKGGAFGMGASMHAVRFKNTRRDGPAYFTKKLLLARNNNGGHLFAIVQPAAPGRAVHPPAPAAPAKVVTAASSRLEEAEQRALHLQLRVHDAQSAVDAQSMAVQDAGAAAAGAEAAAAGAAAAAEKAAAVAKEMAVLLQAAVEAQAGAVAEAAAATAAAATAKAEVEEAREAAKVEYLAAVAKQRREAAALERLAAVAKQRREAAFAAAGAAAAATGGAAAAAAAAMAAGRAAQDALQRSNEPKVFTPAQMEAATAGFTRPLAEGSFGAVYRGVLQPSGCVVAIKVLKLAAAAAAESVAKKHKEFVGEGGFRKELEVLSKYRHQNLVELLGFCLSGGGAGGGGGGGGGGGAGAAAAVPRQCLVFEFCAGGALKDHLASAKALPPPQRFGIASDVARGLHYLHVKADPPIIHQDIKSDNILLAAYDGRLVAKVADFGTARYVPALLESGNTHHSTELVIGTKPYMPLEYLQSGHVSEKTDAFAFGVVLCELLTGEGPANYEKGEMLSAKMYAPLEYDPERQLPPLLDARCRWQELLPQAVSLGKVARRCIDMMASRRCTVADVLPELDAIAGRQAIRRAGRGEEYDPMTGKLRQKRE